MFLKMNAQFKTLSFLGTWGGGESTLSAESWNCSNTRIVVCGLTRQQTPTEWRVTEDEEGTRVVPVIISSQTSLHSKFWLYLIYKMEIKIICVLTYKEYWLQSPLLSPTLLLSSLTSLYVPDGLELAIYTRMTSHSVIWLPLSPKCWG